MHITSDLLKPKKIRWKDSSPKVGYSSGQLDDLAYYANVAFHDPIWRYIVNHYPKEIYDENVSSIVILGYSSIPVAIELSQWSYPITFLTDSYDEMMKAKRDCEIQAGFLKELYYFPYRKNMPKATIIVAIGLLDTLKTYEVSKWVNLMVKRGREILLVVNKRILGHLMTLQPKLKLKIYQYPDKIHYFVSVRG